VRLQFFDGRIAQQHSYRVCADPTVASNIGGQCCNSGADEADVCPINGTYYEGHYSQATHGDLCR
jgi:hypothetical protein